MPYVGKKPADIIATSVDTDTGTFSGNVTAGGTLGVTGAVTADAGVSVDNITIDGTEIDLSSGDLTVDVAGDIILDADGGDIKIKDGGTEFGSITNSSSELHIKATVNDKDIVLAGLDGGAACNALRLDMSAGGAATLNNGLTLADGNLVVASGHGIDFSATGNISGTSSELLSDYEEGTWTPTVETGLAYNQQFGQYVRIGNLVFASFDIRTSSVSASGNEMLGLPFTVANSNSPYGAVNVGYYAGITTAVNWLSGYVSPNSTRVYFSGNSSSHSTIQHNTFNVFNDDTRILGHLVYLTT